MRRKIKLLKTFPQVFDFSPRLQVGLRRRTYSILSGSVLSVWGRVVRILSMNSKSSEKVKKMQVVRLKTREGEKIVGTVIPKDYFEHILQDLSSDAEKVEEIK